MTLISSIIQDAFREGNIIPVGRVVNDLQLTEALRLYNQNLQSTIGSEAGEDLPDWPLGSFGIDDPTFVFPFTNDTLIRPRGNMRLIATNTAPMTVYFDPFPQDGSRMAIVDPFGRLTAFPVTLDANGRTIEGAPTKLLNVSGTFQEWFYRADLGQWTKFSPVLATDENPFPPDFDIFFVCGLAMRLNPRYGRQMDPLTISAYKSARAQMMARYVQSKALEVDDSISWPFLSRQSYGQQREFSSNRAFNRGWYGGS